MRIMEPSDEVNNFTSHEGMIKEQNSEPKENINNFIHPFRSYSCEL